MGNNNDEIIPVTNSVKKALCPPTNHKSANLSIKNPSPYKSNNLDTARCLGLYNN